MKLVTVATHSQGYFPFLLESCKRFNVNLEVLGWGQKWEGFQWRILLMKEYVKNLHDDEIVCFIDAYDVLLLRSLEDLEDAFRKICSLTNKKIVVGCEQAISNLTSFNANVIFGRCQNRPLNAGTYIGYAKDLKTMINDLLIMSDNPKKDDQMLMTNYCNRKNHIFYIDCDSLLFLTIVNPFNLFMKDISYHNKSLIYKDNRPYIVHFPGNGDMNDIIVNLGYYMTKEENDALNQQNKSSQFQKTFHFFPVYVPITLIMIIVICLSIILKNKFKNT